MPFLLLPNAGKTHLSVAPPMQFALQVIAGVRHSAISQHTTPYCQRAMHDRHLAPKPVASMT